MQNWFAEQLLVNEEDLEESLMVFVSACYQNEDEWDLSLLLIYLDDLPRVLDLPMTEAVIWKWAKELTKVLKKIYK